MFRLSCIVLLLLSSGGQLLFSADRFEFTPSARQAYEKVMSLRFEEAKSLLGQIKAADPGNLVVHHIENYIDFLTVYIDENEGEFRRLEKNKDGRLERIKLGDPASPYYLYSQADIRLQWAFIRIKFGDYLSAFNEVSKAYKLLEENQQKFPNFLPNKKDLGILHALVGTIPDNYKWGVKLLGGLNGTIDQGRREIEEVIRYAKTNDFIFEEETLAMYAFLLLYLGNEGDTAWMTLKSSKLNPTNNPMACFILSSLAMRTGRNDEAIRLLQQAPKGKGLKTFPLLDFMLGNAKLRRLDKDADVAFQQYLQHYKGQNGIKETYQKLSWHALIQGDMGKYESYRRQAISKGNASGDGDNNALKEAQSGRKPNLALIKARLLFDGGYYSKAHQLLAQQSLSSFDEKVDRLEYTYRFGRVLHQLHKYSDALRLYKTTIDQGKNEPYYFACNAALQTGFIYEVQKDYSNARAFFEMCLSINPQEHSTSLHHQAKTGLARIKKR